jgi:homoserine kinase type II
MKKLFEKFALSFARQRTDIEIPGSPERCLARFVAEDTEGNLWLVEKLKDKQAAWRNTVGTLLAELQQSGVPHILAPARTPEGESIVVLDTIAYQMTPFIVASTLPRPAYCADKERGRAIGEFIHALQQAGRRIKTPANSTPALPEYVADITDTIRKRRPDIARQLEDILPHLDIFFAEQDSIPLALAHGDCHPLNILWQDTNIAGVIDWEFTGDKIVLYDAANCIGCGGMEHPNWLINGLVPELIKTLITKNSEFAANIHHLIPAIIALRFAWLSEWLRKDDTEMQELELDYMKLLVTSRSEIEHFWKLQYTQ